MKFDDTNLIRQLIPKSFHFDGYNEVNCPNYNNSPLFADGVFELGDKKLKINLVNPTTIRLEFDSTCGHGLIPFSTYRLTLEHFIDKLKTAIKEKSDFITFDIPVSFNNSLSKCIDCSYCRYKNDDCQQLLKTRPTKVTAAVSFNIDEVKKALSVAYLGTNITTTTRGGNHTMKNRKNFFGMNFEYGISKDPNIASTLMGVAVRNTENGNWYVFDAGMNARKNIANMKMGNFPIILLPVNKLEVGSLTKMEGKYYYVKSINPSGTFTLIDATDGVIREIVPETNIISGMNLYTTVVAFDANTLTNISSHENMSRNVLAAMCMMQWANGNGAEFSLDSINDESFNGLGSLWPMLMATGGLNGLGGMFGGTDGSMTLPMLMALGETSGNDSNNPMQFLVLSKLLGGNTNSNPLSSIFGGAASSQEAPGAAKVVCSQCGLTYPDGTNFCPKCGGKTKTLATVCRKCGAELKDGAMFCHVCGTKATQNVCPNCGRAIEGDENFCANCGTNLKATAVTPKTCPGCGRTIEGDESFCAACGHNLKAPASAPALPAAAPAVAEAPTPDVASSPEG